MNDRSKLTRGTVYPIDGWQLYPGSRGAVWDGKPPRCPRRGEWYLSGAIITAYLALNDLDSKYHIAEYIRNCELSASK